MRDFLLPGGLLVLCALLFIGGALLVQPLLLLGAMCLVWPAFWSAFALAIVRFRSQYTIVRSDQVHAPRRTREVLG